MTEHTSKARVKDGTNDMLLLTLLVFFIMSIISIAIIINAKFIQPKFLKMHQSDENIDPEI